MLDKRVAKQRRRERERSIEISRKKIDEGEDKSNLQKYRKGGREGTTEDLVRRKLPQIPEIQADPTMSSWSSILSLASKPPVRSACMSALITGCVQPRTWDISRQRRVYYEKCTEKCQRHLFQVEPSRRNESGAATRHWTRSANQEFRATVWGSPARQFPTECFRSCLSESLERPPSGGDGPAEFQQRSP